MRIVDGALAPSLRWSEIYQEVFAPALHQIGKVWEQDLHAVALCISTEAAAEGLERTIAWLRD